MEAGGTTRWERRCFSLLALMAWGYVIVRAWQVPPIHDEALTWFIYVERGDLLPFRAHPDAGNHVLCTMASWLCTQLFGMHTWAIRLPAVLAYPLFAWSAWRWGLLLVWRPARWTLWAVLLLFPFLIEFFALFRGYGPSVALLSTGLLLLVRWHRNRKDAVLLTGLACLAGATWCNLSLLVVHAAVLGLVAMALLREAPIPWRAWITVAIAGALPWCVAAAYAQFLGDAGALYYGNTAGIMGGSLPSLLPWIIGDGSMVSVWSAVILVVIAAIIAGWNWFLGDRAGRTVAIALFAVLLFVDIGARGVLFHVHGTLYPEDRTALHWAFLGVLLIAFAADATRWRPVGILLCVPLLLLPLRTLCTLHVDRTSFWLEQAIPRAMVDRVLHERSLRADLSVGAYHQMPGVWAFTLRENHLPAMLLQTDGHPGQGTDLLFIDPLTHSAPAGYHRIAEAATGRLDLYRSEHEHTWSTLADTTVNAPGTHQEFMELLHVDVHQLAGQDLRVVTEIVVTSSVAPLRMDLVCELRYGTDERRSDRTLLQYARGTWQQDTLRTTRMVPSVPADATELVLYLWDPWQQPLKARARTRLERAL